MDAGPEPGEKPKPNKEAVSIVKSPLRNGWAYFWHGDR